MEPHVHGLLELCGVHEGLHVVRGDIVVEIRAARNDAVTAAAENASEDVHDGHQPVALVGAQVGCAAQRQDARQGDAVGSQGRSVHLVHDRNTVFVGDPAGEELHAKTAGEDELVGRDDAHRGVKDERCFPVGGGRQGNGVRAEPGFRAEGGIDVCRAGRHGHADHVVLQRHHRVIGDHPQVAAVADRDDANANVPCLLNGDLHRLRADDDAKSAIGVDARGGRSLSQDFPVSGRGDFFLFETLNVAPQRIGDPVALHTAQVCSDQDVRRPLRVFFGNAALEKDRQHNLPQVTLCNSYGVQVRDFQSLDHPVPPAQVRLHREQF